jgi:hypothetical protein
MDKCWIKEPGEYMMDISPDAHLALRHCQVCV